MNYNAPLPNCFRRTPLPLKQKLNLIKKGTEIEKREHPWASTRTAKRIALDHLSKNPNAYKRD